MPHIDARIQALIPELIATRRDLHRHPEIGYEEVRTAGIVAKRLEALGFEVTTGYGGTGVMGLLRGKNPAGPTLAFRADMDALLIQEANTHDFASTIPGKMHACGHDGHTAILLGFARWLAERETPFDGNIKLFFQPAEEGGGGAVKLIEGGALQNPDVDAIFGLHLWALMPTGIVGVKDGPIMAATDEFHITVHGKGGHGAIPQQTVDATLAAAQVVVALQSIASRRVDPLDSVVVSIGQLNSGTAANVISETAEMVGTARSFTAGLRRQLPQMIEDVARHAAATVGADVSFEWISQYPPVINHAAECELVRQAAGKVVDAAAVIEGEATMGGEDMAYYLERVPGCFFFVGAGNRDKGIDKPHHNPCFDIDEDALPLGVALFAQIACDWFSQRG